MIEKLEKHIIGENAPGTVSLMVAPTTEQQVDKINELVDAVNSLRDDCNLLMGYIAPENKCKPAPHPEPFHTDCGESEQGWYPHCEPVKPDDDIIYKGGDNE